MSFFVYGGSVSYTDFLKEKKYLINANTQEKKIRLDISRQTREIIATTNNLASDHIGIQNSVDGIDGYETLTIDINDMVSDRGEINAKIHCAFSNLLIQSTDSMTKYTEMNALAKQQLLSPADKLYERARSAFVVGSYSEAFDVLQNTLDISRGSLITKAGWQHYQMLGILYLGFADCDFSLINLDMAEQSFLESAQFTKEDNPYECAKSYLLAGWAAYCQGRLAQAEEYAENAINLSRILAEAKFLMAKILFARGDIEKATIYIGKAIETDPFYAIKAAGEADIQNNDESLRSLLDSIREKFAFYLTNLSSDFELAISEKDVVEVMQNDISKVLEDKSLYSYVSEYRRLCKAPWILTEGSITLGEIRNVIVKQENWYSTKVVEQVRDEYDVKFVNYNLIGFKHSIEMTFTCNLIELEQSPFYIGKTLVTQALWNAVMGHKVFHVSGPTFPAYEVNWYDCIRFCNKLSILLDLPPYYHIKNNYNPLDWTMGYIECNLHSDGFRLPTESEWEFAAKGGAYTHKHPFAGSNEANDVAWFDKNSKGKIQPVALKKPNELDLYDMSGNVWEWCWNFYNDTERRILRGGAFFSSASLCAVTGRGHASAANPGIGNGLRLVRNA